MAVVVFEISCCSFVVPNKVAVDPWFVEAEDSMEDEEVNYAVSATLLCFPETRVLWDLVSERLFIEPNEACDCPLWNGIRHSESGMDIRALRNLERLVLNKTGCDNN